MGYSESAVRIGVRIRVRFRVRFRIRLRGFASDEGGILSGGWLWKWKPPDDPGIE